MCERCPANEARPLSFVRVSAVCLTRHKAILFSKYKKTKPKTTSKYRREKKETITSGGEMPREKVIKEGLRQGVEKGESTLRHVQRKVDNN